MNKIYTKFIKRNAGLRDIADPAREEFKVKIADKQKYSCFYP